MHLVLVIIIIEEVFDDASFVVRLQRLSELVNISVHDGSDVCQGQSYAVVRNSVLYEVICPNLFAPVSTANELSTRFASLDDFRLEFAVKKPCFEDTVRPSLVHMLAAFVLHRHGDACRDVREADGRLCFVDVLSASASCSHDFDLYVLVVVELFFTPNITIWSFVLEGKNLDYL